LLPNPVGIFPFLFIFTHQSKNYFTLCAQMPEKEEQQLLDDAEFK
jgi:hypothetical protein